MYSAASMAISLYKRRNDDEEDVAAALGIFYLIVGAFYLFTGSRWFKKIQSTVLIISALLFIIGMTITVRSSQKASLIPVFIIGGGLIFFFVKCVNYDRPQVFLLGYQGASVVSVMLSLTFFNELAPSRPKDSQVIFTFISFILIICFAAYLCSNPKKYHRQCSALIGADCIYTAILLIEYYDSRDQYPAEEMIRHYKMPLYLIVPAVAVVGYFIQGFTGPKEEEIPSVNDDAYMRVQQPSHQQQITFTQVAMQNSNQRPYQPQQPQPQTQYNPYSAPQQNVYNYQTSLNGSIVQPQAQQYYPNLGQQQIPQYPPYMQPAQQQFTGAIQQVHYYNPDPQSVHRV